MTFLISLLLLAWCSLRWSGRFAGSRGDAFWIFIAAAMLQIGAIASLASLVHELTPLTWLLLQGLFCAVTLRSTGGLARPGRQRHVAGAQRLRGEFAAFSQELTPWGVAALLALGVMLLASFVVQAATPIHGFDEKMYHASRVLYWIQYRSVFPFETHNLRQTILPFGSELLFLWPVLLTKSELVGRLIFWLAYPAAAVGLYLLLRALRLRQTAALAGALILVSTPLVAASAVRLKPEIWSALTLLGVAWWAVSLCGRAEGTRTRYVFLGIFTVLSINVRPFAVALLPVLLLLALWAPDRLSVATRLKSIAAGLACAGALSALLVPLVANTALYRHPLGPPEARAMVQAQVTPRMLYTHAVRFAFLMLELPDVPAPEEARAAVGGAANAFIAKVGAAQPLAGEDQLAWVGRYAYALPEHALRFSFWGMLWLPTLLLAAALLVRNLAATWPRVTLTALSAQSLLALPLLAAVLFGARWMSYADIPGRFLIGPYALVLPLGMALLVPWLAGRRFAQALAALAVVYCVYHPLRAQAYDAVQALVAPIPDRTINEPFEEVVGSIAPPGSRILFVGGQDARDYPLFSAATHYANTVVPWGWKTFDPARMRQVIAAQRVTHVLVQDEELVTFAWASPLDTRAMVAWLARENGIQAIPVKAPRMRLFEVGEGRMNEGAFAIAGLPAATPLITVDAALRNQVGIDPALLETPWVVEDLGGAEGGFLWMGQGHAEGISFALWSRQDREVELRFHVSPGPSLAAPQRKVILQVDGVPVGDEHAFARASTLVLRTRLHRGRNLVSFFAVDAATVKSLPNGDTRRLVVGLHDIGIGEVAGAPSGKAAAPSPAAGADARADELARSARQAIGLISRRQQADGFWVTSYTSVERFESPKREMNTFVTSTMVDLLADHVPAGLAGSVERARVHLRAQIEPTGLVRYHGRPDAAAMTTYGLCPITPDADDTALVWRIAPAAAPLRNAALETLARYRTAEGLYHSWLGQRSEFRCIDPGADPNPTDIAIQMHVLLFLAQADPPAARALCGALQRTVDQDRLWVYYRLAPLVPVLRQSWLRAAGCELPLPPARSETTLAHQKIWLRAGHMLRRLEGAASQFPPAAEIADVLSQLANDGFAPVRLTPPLLYHNDETASVRRFYWAEDVGYAIWLKLYRDAVRLQLLRADPDSVSRDGGTTP